MSRERMKQEMKRGHHHRQQMTTHEPNRQVTDEEKRLWKEIKQRDRCTPDDHIIRMTKVGSDNGIKKHRGKQILASWDDEGLIRLVDNAGLKGFLTEYGRQVDSIESSMVSGESWR